MDEKDKGAHHKDAKELNEDGLRILIVAVKTFDNRDPTYSMKMKKDMIMAGFVGFP